MTGRVSIIDSMTGSEFVAAAKKNPVFAKYASKPTGPRAGVPSRPRNHANGDNGYGGSMANPAGDKVADPNGEIVQGPLDGAQRRARDDGRGNDGRAPRTGKPIDVAGEGNTASTIDRADGLPSVAMNAWKLTWFVLQEWLVLTRISESPRSDFRCPGNVNSYSLS